MDIMARPFCIGPASVFRQLAAVANRVNDLPVAK
jgi:hypothetical protein